MCFKRRVNQIRRHFMHSLTGSIGRTDDIIDINNHNITNILICRPNSRLGNQLLITPVIQEISNNFPNCKIDLFVRGGAAFAIFKNYQNIDRIIHLPQKPFSNIIQYLYVWYSIRQKKYDLVINITNGSSSGKLAAQIAKSKRKIFGVMDDNLLNVYNDYTHMAKAPIYNLRKSLGTDSKMDHVIPPLDIKLDITEKKRGQDILFNLVKNNKATICIYTYATGTKCYPTEWWTPLYGLLKEKYEQKYNIIEILPKENVSQINFEAPSYYSTDIREIAALVSNTILFIGADSGIMHLSSSSEAQTIGLFSVSCLHRYQPYGKKNTAIDTKDKSFEDIINIIALSLAT